MPAHILLRSLLLAAVVAASVWALREHHQRFFAPDPLDQAESLLAAGRLESAERMVHAVLARAPLQGRAYRLLAQSAERAGDSDRAATLYAQAVQVQPRDLASRQWLAARALSQGDLATALAHYDRMLRIRPSLAPALYPLLTTLVEQGAAAALLPLLEVDPPWRQSFLAQIAQTAARSEVLHVLFQPLAKAPAPLRENERAVYLERLLRDQRYTEAYLAWVGFLPESQRGELGNLFDGGFEQPPENAGFGWRFGRAAGASIDRQRTAGAGGQRALRIDFANRRVPFSHVSQLLALGPGRYRLQGRARLEDLRNERGLRWRLHCAQGRSQTLAETERLSGNQPWRPFTVEFEVPAADCQGQWLQLELAARIPAEQRIGGRARYDDLRIVRRP